MRRIYILLALVIIGNSVLAQDKISNQQVEVTKEYAPEVQGASKLTPTPNLVDTVKLYPEGNYTIYPTAWTTSFGVQALSPVRVNAGGQDAQLPYYIKIGAGLSANSTLDFYGSKNWDNGALVGYVNHRGYYGKIVNDLDQKVSAPYSKNTAGINILHNIKDRKSFQGEISYNYDYLTRYGAFSPMSAVSVYSLADSEFNPEHINYNALNLDLFYGDDFQDLSTFNFAMNLGASTFSDKEYRENDIELDLAIGKQFGVHSFTLKGSFEGTFGNYASSYKDITLGLSPRYMINTNRFDFVLGVDYFYDNLNANAKSYLFPALEITYDVARGYFVPFVTISGELERNGYRNTSLQNPYIQAGYTMDNSAIYSGRAGISGSFASSFTYRLFAGMDFYRKLNNFMNVYSADNSTSFVSFSDKANCFVLGGNIGARLARGLTLDLSANYYNYDLTNLEYAGSRPVYDANFLLAYSLQNKFSLRLEANLIGNRYFYELTDSSVVTESDFLENLSTVSQKAVVDLSLGVDYRISPVVILFVEGSNLANMELYPYNHYKGFGINFNIGAKLTF